MHTTAFWRIYDFLHNKARFNPEIRVTDRELANKFGVTREYANECLRKLVELGIIIRNRIGEHGKRLIKWIMPFAKPKPRPKPALKADPTPELAGNRPTPRSPEMARKILDGWKAAGWTLKLTGPRQMVIAKLRPDADPADLCDDLKQQAKDYRESILDLLESDRE